MRKVALYCRVSSARQEKEKTIQTQIAKLKEIYTKAEIVKEYLDDGYSGADIDRPGLNQLREDVKNGLFNTVALYSFDRLSRKVGHQLVIKEELTKNDIKVEVLGRKLEDTPEGEFGEIVLGAVSQLERERIIQRMKDGKSAKINAGKLIASYPSYGYDYIKRKPDRDACFKVNFKEARVVKLIFKMYLDVQNINEVARRLTKMGLKSRGRRMNSPCDFRVSVLREMLKNEVYIGNYYYGRTYSREAKYHVKENRKNKLTAKSFRPRSEWKLIKVPEIIDKRIFNRVQEIRKRRQKEFYKPTKFFYLCQGLIRCIHCGQRYYGMPHKNYRDPKRKIYLSYCCRGKIVKKDNKPCPSRYISVPKLDNYVWEYISSLVKDSDRVKKAIKLIQEKRDKDKGFNQEVYNSLITEKSKIKVKKQRFLDLYGDKNISREDLDEKILILNG